VLTTYNMTEHWCGGGDTRNTPYLLEAEPQLYVEMSHELAAEKGIKNGDHVVVESIRGKVEAVAMVTVRITPFLVRRQDRASHRHALLLWLDHPRCGRRNQPSDSVQLGIPT
jgi:anaerobic selenocysteine-containing dehydrogenase